MGSASGREGLAHVHTVIVDEIHALAGNKRGAHLALTLERLQALCKKPLRRIGLSATQRPVERVAQFLVGSGRPCAIVDIGHARKRDLAIEVPPVPLGAVMATDVWGLVYDRLATLAREHRTTLVFVNTRRLAERITRHLSDRLGKEAVAAHHGSLSKALRLDAEQRLKSGQLQVLVATASLELGIDIGDIDLVCQVASPGSIAGFLQRVGRAGHQVDGVPKGRLFPTSRDDLIECVALLDCVRQGELDALHIPGHRWMCWPSRSSQKPATRPGTNRICWIACARPHLTPSLTSTITRPCCACSPRATTAARVCAVPTCTVTQ